MKYCEYTISAPLRPYVTLIWSMESEGQTDNISPVRILPDTCVELVIHFRKPYVTTFEKGIQNRQPQSFIVGQMKRAFEMEPSGEVGIVAARFSAWGAYHFFAFPLLEVANQFVALECLGSQRLKKIGDRIISEDNTDARVERLQQILQIELCNNGRHDKTVDQALSLIYGSKGLLSVRDLARNVGSSERQLLRRFDSRVGLSPKEFSRIVRLHQALKTMHSRPGNSLTDVSHECGYYDQAHFIRDFTAFTGLTPGKYLDRKGNTFF